MYISSYKINKRSLKNKKARKRGKGIFIAIKRFLKLSLFILAIIPAVYLVDQGYDIVRHAIRFPLMKVNRIEVSDTFYVNKDELVTMLKDIKGKSIFQISLAEVTEKLKEHPWIKDVSIRRELPSTLIINLVERIPALSVHSNGKEYLVDEEGFILGLNQGDVPDLPVVYGLDIKELNTGERIEDQGFHASLAIKKELSYTPWIDSTSFWIEVENKKDIILHLKGFRIKLGNGDYREKLYRFHAIIEDLKKRDVKYREIDLRFKDQVIVRTFET